MRRIVVNSQGSTRELEASLISNWVRQMPRDCALSPRKPLPPDRWLLGSALQKAIRRGLDVEALQVAHALHEADATYAWRRLRVIALEDVGLGDIETVATLLAVAGKQQLRQGLGDERLYLSFVRALAVAPKDRTACDLLCWIELSPDVMSYRTGLLDSPERWEPLALDDEAPIWQRTVALQLIAGLTVRTRSGYQTLSRADAPAWHRVVDALSLHPLVALATRKGTGTESLNVALPFAYWLYQQASVRPLRTAALDSSPRIGCLLAPAYDMHTRAGLQALRLFLKSEPAIRRQLLEAGAMDQIRALGFLLFQIEGGLLDRYEDYAPQVRVEAERAELAHYGVRGDATTTALRSELQGQLPALHDARRASWCAYRPMIGAPVAQA